MHPWSFMLCWGVQTLTSHTFMVKPPAKPFISPYQAAFTHWLICIWLKLNGTVGPPPAANGKWILISILESVFLQSGWRPAGQMGRQCVAPSRTLSGDGLLPETENQMTRSKAQWSLLREWRFLREPHFLQRHMALLQCPLKTGPHLELNRGVFIKSLPETELQSQIM